MQLRPSMTTTSEASGLLIFSLPALSQGLHYAIVTSLWHGDDMNRPRRCSKNSAPLDTRDEKSFLPSLSFSSHPPALPFCC